MTDYYMHQGNGITTFAYRINHNGMFRITQLNDINDNPINLFE